MTRLIQMPIESLRAMVGGEVGVSGWVTVDQARIDAFAAVTNDLQFIHVDPDKARAEAPFSGTIAHGFLTLSLLSAMAYEAAPGIAGARMGVNYGFDRVRFVAPVRSGARIRARFHLLALDESRAGEVGFRYEVSIEVDGQEKPALAAIWLTRAYM